MSLSRLAPRLRVFAPSIRLARVSPPAAYLRRYTTPVPTPTQLQEEFDNITEADAFFAYLKSQEYTSEAVLKKISAIEAIPETERVHSDEAHKLLDEIVQLVNQDGSPRTERVGTAGADTFKKGDAVWAISSFLVTVLTILYLIQPPAKPRHHGSSTAESEAPLPKAAQEEEEGDDASFVLVKEAEAALGESQEPSGGK